MHFQGLFSSKYRVERSSKSFKSGFCCFCLNLSHQYWFFYVDFIGISTIRCTKNDIFCEKFYFVKQKFANVHLFL